MKKIFLFFVFLLSFSLFSVEADCNYTDGGSASIKTCLTSWSQTWVLTGSDYKIEWEAKTTVVKILNNGIRWLGGMVAIIGIIMSGRIAIFSMGSDEKIKNAKTAFGAAVGGFMAILLGPTIVNLIVDFVYTVLKVGGN